MLNLSVLSVLLVSHSTSIISSILLFKYLKPTICFSFIIESNLKIKLSNSFYFIEFNPNKLRLSLIPNTKFPSPVFKNQQIV